MFQLYIQDGNLDNAYTLLDTLLINYPDDIEILYAQANIQYTNQDWANLMKTYYSIYKR